MGLRDLIFGKQRLKEASPDRLFALSTARITLEVDLGLKPAGTAAVAFKPLSASEFGQAARDLEELLEVTARDTGSQVERRDDEYGYRWVVVRDTDFEDLVTTVHLVTSELIARGFGPQLLASIFRFDDPASRRPVFWIYAYKRGAFYPFVPTGEGQERDNARELDLKAKLERELPIEEDITRWFALFDAPL